MAFTSIIAYHEQLRLAIVLIEINFRNGWNEALIYLNDKCVSLKLLRNFIKCQA